MNFYNISRINIIERYYILKKQNIWFFKKLNSFNTKNIKYVIL